MVFRVVFSVLTLQFDLCELFSFSNSFNIFGDSFKKNRVNIKSAESETKMNMLS